MNHARVFLRKHGGVLALALGAWGFTTSSALALQLPPALYADASASWGISKPAVETTSDRPTFTHLGLGATIAYRIGPFWFAGLTSDFRTAGQYSDILPVIGEISGHRWNILSPTLGWRGASGLTVKLDAELLGSYQLTRRGAGLGGAAESISYGRPLGGRLVVLYPMSGSIHAGGQYELMTYGQRTSTSRGTEELTSREAIWQLSLTAGYLF